MGCAFQAAAKEEDDSESAGREHSEQYSTHPADTREEHT